jgi:hypothetical protein
MSSIQTSMPVATPDAHIGRVRRLIGPAAALAVGGTVLLLTQNIAEPDIATGLSPRWWPGILGGTICLLSIGVAIKDQLVTADKSDDELMKPTRLGMIRVAAVIAAAIGYGVLWYFLDFRIATFVLVAGLAFIIGGRGWRALVLFPFVVSLVLYALFVLLLKVPL